MSNSTSKDVGQRVAYWLGERLRDFAFIFINTVRDLPVRLGRLAALLLAGIYGISRFLTQLPQNAGNFKWWRTQYHLTGVWSHQLLVGLFDLLSMPEICQFLMHLFMPTSPLTPTEIKAVSAIIGEKAVRWEDVRIAQGGLLRLIFRYNGGRAFATWHTIHLPNAGKFARGNLSLLVHELTHVYQYETIGTRYITEALYVQAKVGQSCYRYGGHDGLAEACQVAKQFAEYNREAQAQIAQDYYERLNAGKDVSYYKPFINELNAGKF